MTTYVGECLLENAATEKDPERAGRAIQQGMTYLLPGSHDIAEMIAPENVKKGASLNLEKLVRALA